MLYSMHCFSTTHCNTTVRTCYLVHHYAGLFVPRRRFQFVQYLLILYQNVFWMQPRQLLVTNILGMYQVLFVQHSSQKKQVL